MVPRQFRCEALCETDDRALGRGIIGVKHLSALAGSRTDKNNMTKRLYVYVLFHLRNRMYDEAENGIQIDRQRTPPLVYAHFVDQHIIDKPDPMIHNQNIKLAEPLDGRRNESLN